MKLKQSEIKTYRLNQLKTQKNLCSLCGLTIVDDAVLDHDHKTGLVRKVLHRGCNSLLGKIENALPRSRMSLDSLKVFASNLTDYIELTHTQLIHPTFKTKEEKIMAKKKKGGGRGRGR
jgi:hypothetical protein